MRKVISQMVECRLVLCMRKIRGDSVRATSEVEKSISKLDTSPSRDSDCFPYGSALYIRYPLVVPTPSCVWSWLNVTKFMDVMVNRHEGAWAARGAGVVVGLDAEDERDVEADA